MQRGLSVCLSVTTVSPSKTAEQPESFEMPFWLRTRMGRRNLVLDGDPDPPPWEGAILRGEGTVYREVNGIPFMCGGDAACCQLTLTSC